MKLQSTTDFVLEQEEINLMDNFFEEIDKYFNRCVRYAKFLKQPINKGMFVPCDLEGNVLEEPKNYNLWCKYGDFTQYGKKLTEQCIKYKQAQERVLFKGCEAIQQGENTIIMFNHTAIWLTWTSRVIEDMIPNYLTLTESAIKQFM